MGGGVVIRGCREEEVTKKRDRKEDSKIFYKITMGVVHTLYLLIQSGA